MLTQSSAGGRIRTELTATERTGLARFDFPANEPAYLLIDWHHVYGTDNQVRSADLRVVGETHFEGGRHVSKWAPDREIYFATEIDTRPMRIEMFSDDQPVRANEASGKNLKLVLHFAPGSTMQVKSGISMVSAANARRNLQTEQQGFQFDQVRARAKARWNRELSRMRIEDANTEHKRVF